MPVVTLYFDRVTSILGKKISKEKIISTLPFIGLDIEEETKNYVNVEYSPNRPDYSTDYGIVSSLQGLLGIKTGMPKLKIKKGKDTIIVNPSVRKIRPFVTAMEAKNGKLDDETIQQLIVMQEDLHNGIGRRRKKTSIGIHDLDKISFPLTYTTTSKNHKFIPLESSQEMTINEILEKDKTGIKYGHLIKNEKAPIILDSKNHTISFPPIINSERTKISKNTKNLLVEVTAIEKNAAEDTLAVIANILQDAGFELFSIKISGANNSTPLLKPRSMVLDAELVNKILGIKISIPKMVSALRKSRLDAQGKGKKIVCTIPRYRTDIFGPMDLVEEVALGYGIENFEPTIPESVSVGQKNKTTTTLYSISSVMIGLGYSEVMNLGLVSQRVLYDYTKRDASKIISVSDSKSQEHTILRNAILPGLIDTLSRNIHEPYPQMLFETGTIFLKNNDEIKEEIHLACVSAHNDVSFTEIKSVLQSFLKTTFGLECKTITSSNPMFVEGRSADIFVNNKIGEIGEILPEIIDNFKLRVPIAGFEIRLTGLY
ncbi:MAG: phenylalanine--tRNA ligase subunit beta [Thaumarchaeota archaeon]|nr:phenylalanine--tRNA ligase subunit beta [Nitrososphaerota archaeon]MBI3640989.1 phenylalanine--tRNA ligase subunit beta [Nitrososphaerota archaeon]